MKSISKLASVILFCGMQLFTMGQGTAKVVFATQPFSSNPAPQTSFKHTDHIYAKMIFDKPFKDYCSSKFYNIKDHYGIADKNVARIMSFIVKAKNEEGEYETVSYTNIDFMVSKQDFESKEINMDITPSRELASTLCSEGSEFFRVFADSRFADGKKQEFKLDIGNNNDLLNGISGFEIDGQFSIDYNGATSDSQQEAFDYGRKAWDAAKLNGNKMTVKISSEAVKSMPAPLCFSKGVNAGYKGPEYSTAKIMALLKQKYGIT